MAGGILGGGLSGLSGLRGAGGIAVRRLALKGLASAGPELFGAGVGAAVGYGVAGTSTGALHGATIGMFVGGFSGGGLRGLAGTRRALAPRGPGASHGLYKVSDDLPGGTNIGGITRSELIGIPQPWRLFKPKFNVEIHMPQGLAATDPKRYARYLSQEIRHALDFLDNPGFAYFATYSERLGAGLAHYVFEARGYLQSHGLRGLIRGPLGSVRAYTRGGVPQFRHHLFYRDSAIAVSILALGPGLYFGGAYDSSTYLPLFEN